jgi:protein-tyrosine kinase
MSRIREALKKAAEERSAISATQGVADVGDILDGALPDVTPAAVVQLVATATEPAPPPVTARKVAPPPPTDYANFVAKCRHVQWNIEPRYSVFANETNHRAGAERFRTLRSRLHQIAAAQPLRRVLLTSSVPQEGKTFVASNLAQSIVRQADRKVLLIDADLRASRLNITLGAESTPGLSDYLTGDTELTKVVQVGGEGNLCFIPGGREVPNPSELLHSDRMSGLLEKMGHIFDWIILDSPPAIAVHDPSILADMCDGVLFVVRAGSTDFEMAQKAIAEFPEKKVLGVVLNRVDKNDSYGEYYYGYSKERDE